MRHICKHCIFDINKAVPHWCIVDNPQLFSTIHCRKPGFFYHWEKLPINTQISLELITTDDSKKNQRKMTENQGSIVTWIISWPYTKKNITWNIVVFHTESSPWDELNEPVSQLTETGVRVWLMYTSSESSGHFKSAVTNYVKAGCCWLAVDGSHVCWWCSMKFDTLISTH